MAGREDTITQLSRCTSFRIGGWTRRFYSPATIQELQDVLGLLYAAEEKPFILGGGCNVLFPDGEFSRPIVCTRRMNRYRVDGSRLRVESGVLMSRLIRVSCAEGLSGLESMVGIPGTAGGAVAMNAGGRGRTVGDRVEELCIVPLDGGPPIVRRGSDVEWGYRHAGLGPAVVAWVTLRLEPDSSESVRQRVRVAFEPKLATQPLGSKSAGCVFRNPRGVPAARMIDQLGLKGLARGGARVSERHANFIVNENGSASSADVRSLLEEVRARVAAAFGVRLETEIVLA